MQQRNQLIRITEENYNKLNQIKTEQKISFNKLITQLLQEREQNQKHI